jgi:hypothetical protein
VAITIEPLGGLGNQLFVYATGRARALDLETDLQADLRHFISYEWHEYELDSFRSVLSLTQASRMYERRRRLTEASRRVRAKVGLSRSWRSGGDFVEASSRFDPRVNHVPDGTRLRGYFQSFRYFERHAERIREDVHSLLNPSPWYADLVSRLQRLDPWIAVHVRRGNYTGLPNMGLAGDDFYQGAIELLRDSTDAVPLVVFSDDAAAARDMAVFRGSANIHFIESPADSRPLETILAMSLCHHIVTANSSFSWWAAWLNDTPGRRVVCPRPWLNDPNFDERDLLPAHWLTLGRT